MKRSKLIMSIISCCFALSVLVFGVYASLSVNFNLSGTISFDPHGVDATITTQVFKYKEKIDREQAYLKACDLQSTSIQDLDYETLLSEEQVFKTKEGNTYYPNLEQDLSDSVLNFEDCEAYFIVVHVLPNSTYNLEEHNQIVFVELKQEDLDLPTNVWLAYNDKYLVIYPSAQQEGGLNMIFFLGITEPYKQIPEDEFTLTLSFEYKDIYVPTQDDLIDDVEDGVSIKVAELEDDDGILYYDEIIAPEFYNNKPVYVFQDYYDEMWFRFVVLSKNYGANINYDLDSYTSFNLAYFTKVHFDQRNTNFSSLDDVVFNKEKTTLYRFSSDKNLLSYIIPSFVENIANYAFSYCKHLETIFIPKSVQTMGDGVCDDLMEKSNFKIYCEAAEQPSGWDNSWNSGNYPIEWGVTRDDYLKAIEQ